jgi:type I restriction enzyme S subunit
VSRYPCFENGKGALVVNLRNGFGFGSTEFHVIRADETKINPRYIYYQTVSDDFRGKGEANMAGSAGQKRVPTDFVKNYRITLPSLKEQHKIAAVLQACDEEIELLGQKLAAFKRQKRGLMQRLLSGQVRVKTEG